MAPLLFTTPLQMLQAQLILQRKFQFFINDFSIPGYVGNFQCTQPSGSCKTYTMGTTSNGNFAYDYSTNAAVLNATKATDNTNTTSTVLTRLSSSRNSRLL
jgi:hypothetical protein